MKCKWDGKHKGHNTIPLRETKNMLKTNVEKCIKTLENNGRIIQNIQQKATKEMEKIQSKKEQAKKLVKQHFDEIRRVLEENESKMLNTIDEIQLDEDKFSKCIMEAQNTFASLSSTYQKAKSILTNMNTIDITGEIVSESISIVNGTSNMCDIGHLHKEIDEKEIFIDSIRLEKDVKTIIQLINTIREVKMKRVSTLCPKGLIAKGVGAFFVSLEWDKDEDDEKYIVAMQKEGAMWDPKL